MSMQDLFSMTGSSRKMKNRQALEVAGGSRIGVTDKRDLAGLFQAEELG